MEKPVIVAISTSRKKDSGLSLAALVMARSTMAPPQPAICNCQKARFLLAKNGVGRIGKTPMVPI